MPIKDYGVWKATPTRFTAERSDQDSQSPHGSLRFEDGVSSKRLSSAINVKSLDRDSRLVFWQFDDFKHPLQDVLGPLELGWHAVSRGDRGPPNGKALDLLRGDVIDAEQGRIVPHDVPGQQNDIIDFLDPFFQKAIKAKATVYLYGQQYGGKDGVHDVHMNQGSTGRFRSSNGIYQDGGIIVEYADGHWEAFFIAFASQAMSTDDGGQVDGPLFGEVLRQVGDDE